MPSSIQFTQEEAQRIFRAFVPGFRADARGRYRGPATYRGGDNKQALCIDTKQGKWFDFVTGEGGDVIALVQKYKECDFREACSISAASSAESYSISRTILGAHARPKHGCLRRSYLQPVSAGILSEGWRG